MRNIFDQYDQFENKLTHALVCTLSEDRSLLRPFLDWMGATRVPSVARLHVVEQRVPGAIESDDVDAVDRRGLPDVFIYDDDGWALLIEVKVQSGVGADQLRRHIATAKQHGFAVPQVVVIAVDRVADHPSREWRHVYQWFRRRDRESEWARRFADYIEVFENRAIAGGYEIRGTLTMFDGLRFDESKPYTWHEGKRLIRLLGDELQKRSDLHELGIDPDGERRSAISGRTVEVVWDFLPLKAARGAATFTNFPHLTMVIERTGAKAATTVPNSVKGGIRTKLTSLGNDGFRNLVAEVYANIGGVVSRSRGAAPMLYATQRHFLSQSAPSIEDGRLDVDLAVLNGDSARGVRCQPEWIDAVYAILTNKNSNVQWGFEVRLSYECPIVSSVGCVELFAESWKASKPLLDFVLG